MAQTRARKAWPNLNLPRGSRDGQCGHDDRCKKRTIGVREDAESRGPCQGHGLSDSGAPASLANGSRTAEPNVCM